jgi:aminopeptidase-like protein
MSLPPVAERIEALLPSTKELEAYFDRLWPICRSLTGDGFRKSLAIVSEIAPYEKLELPTGRKVFDWTIPKEWNIAEAWIADSSGKKVVDFKNSNLHVLGYSTPVDRELDLAELQEHLHSLPELPHAIPYRTSYYEERWGFCLAHAEREKLKPGKYRVVIRSRLEAGSLTLGRLTLPATSPSKRDFLIASYLCHPSMANNELSGPLVAAFVYRALSKLPKRRLNYRFAIGPETIGAISHLALDGEAMKSSLQGGLVATCLGDGRNITYKKSRRGAAPVDRVAANALKHYGKPHETLDFFPWGSDERQYCSPGFDLPVGSLMRTMYTRYPEYHTSLDDKSLISFDALRESVGLYLRVILANEANGRYVTTVAHGEPMLGARGLYPSLSTRKTSPQMLDRMMWIVNFSDGKHDLCAIADKIGCPLLELVPIVELLIEKGLLQDAEPARD